MKDEKKTKAQLIAELREIRRQRSDFDKLNKPGKQTRSLLATQSEVLEMVALGAGLTEALERLCLLIEQQSAGALCSILLFDETDGKLRSAAAPSLPQEYARALDGLMVGEGQGSCGTAAARGKPVIVRDIAEDPLWAGFRDLALKYGIRSCWSTPFFSRKGRVLGTFAISHKAPASPTPFHSRIIKTATHLAAIATERRQAENRLKLSEESYRSLVNNATDAIYIQDREGRFLDVNDGVIKMYGYPKEFFIGNTPEPLAAPGKNDLQKVVEHIEKAFAGEPRQFEFWGKKSNGKIFPKIVRLQRGKYFGQDVIIAFAVDISKIKMAEEALRESEEKYRKIFENVRDVFYQTGHNGKITEISPSIERHSGYKREALIGTQIKNFYYYPKDYGDLCEKLVTNGEVDDFEVRLKDKEGRLKYVSVNARVVLDSDGNPVASEGTLRDITERKRAETLQSEQRRVLELISLGEASQTEVLEAIAQIAEAHFTDVRASILLLDGRTLRHGAAPSMPRAYNTLIDGLPIGPAAGSCGTAMYRKERVIVEDISSDPLWADYRQLGKDYGFRACWSQPICAASGNVLGSFALYREQPGGPTEAEIQLIRSMAQLAGVAIERKQSEDNIKRGYETLQVLNSLLQISIEDKPLEEILATALEIILSAPLMHLSPKGGIFLVESGVLRLKAQKNLPAVRQNICDSVAFGHCLCGRAAESKEIQFADCVDERHENQYEGITQHGHYNVPILHSGEALGVIVLYLDHGHVRSEHEIGFLQGVANTLASIIERQRVDQEKARLETQLRRSQKLETIGTLAGGIAHDFNNILTPIVGYADMALSSLSPTEQLSADLQHILDGAHRAKDLVNQILTFSRQHEQDRKPLHLHRLIKETLRFLRPSIPTTIEIRQRLDATCERVLADETQIHQVIVNLCANAFQAMEEAGGVLTIELQQVEVDALTSQLYPILQQREYALLTVSDTGIGMDKATLERIFEPFFTTKAVDRGTGLGLSVVHGIVRSHDGEIVVKGEMGKGSSFQVYLPILAGWDEQEEKAPESIPGGNESILVVDDEEAVIDVLGKMLGRLGYQVVARNGSVEALKAFRESPQAFDLIITDLTMPCLTGLELAKEITRMRSQIPVILMTGYGKDMSGDMHKRYGVTAIISKPIVMRELAIMIRKVIDK